MLTTKQKTLRRFWYATLKMSDLANGPKAFRLMAEDLVLFLDGSGKPAALRDRCCHRTARLSKGWCEGGNIVCGYHGWTYSRTGALTSAPQMATSEPSRGFRVEAFRCEERYGYVWVCLGEPLAGIPDIPEEGDRSYRRIHQFHEVWRTAPLRFMENSFDNAHFSFVHRGTFGQYDQPVPKRYELNETGFGFTAYATVDIVNPPKSHRITGTASPITERKLRNEWYLPFSRRLDIEYVNGLRHIIVNCATPIDDDHTLIAQLLYRNDKEEDCSTDELVAWDRAVIDEDREILESTDYDVSLDVMQREEAHMSSDRPGLIMRKRLLQLLAEHEEREVRGEIRQRPLEYARAPTIAGQAG